MSDANGIIIEESGLDFGPFDPDSCFHIEQSKTYRAISENVKIAEFIVAKDSKLWIVEAKSSIPNEKKSKERYEDYFNDICQKLENTLALGVAATLKRHNVADEPPVNFTSLELGSLPIHMVLVIAKLPDRFLSPIQADLRKHLKKTTSLWSNTTAWVFNAGMAAENYLIRQPTPK